MMYFPHSIKREQPKALIYKDLSYSLMLFCRLFVALIYKQILNDMG